MVKIREIYYEDVKKYESELRRYLELNLTENYPEIDTVEMGKKFYQNMVNYALDGSAILLGAFSDDSLIGFHWAHESVFLGKKRIHSYMNAVDPKYRGQHIGSNFFRKLEEITLNRGIVEIEAFCRATNPVAVNYHLHNGFEIENYRVVKTLTPNDK